MRNIFKQLLCMVIAMVATYSLHAQCTPLPVTGPTFVCPGNTISLSDATSGGTWSSGNPAIATVGSTGIVTGVAAGNVVISYTYVSGCTGYAFAIITVGNPIINTIAGTGTSGYSGDGAAATTAAMNYPTHTAMDAAGNLYFGDFTNARIRMINPSGIVATVAGTGTPGYTGDGIPATTSRIVSTAGMVTDAAGNLYFSDYGGFRVRKLSTTGIITTIAGTGVTGFGGDGVPASSAAITNPWGVVLDQAGNLYFCDRYNQRIRKIDGSGIITTIAGNGTAGFFGDGGAATAALISDPTDLAIDLNGNIYFTENADNRVRKISNTGIITSICGNGVGAFFGDGGAATAGRVNGPVGITVDTAGNVYIGDWGNNRIRKINTSGTLSTIAGTAVGGYNGDGGNPATTELFHPYGVSVFGTGDIYICDVGNARIRKISPIAPAALAAISGVTPLCQGVPVLFTDALTGGTWSSSNTAIAVVGSATGYVTGVAAGTATITYSFSYTCGTYVATMPVTINAFTGGTITGPTNLCVGNTITLTDALGGGTWSSSNPAVATVGSTGVVTGVTIGSTAISYTVTNGCGTIAATAWVTVGNPIITTIAGGGASLGDGGPATAGQLTNPTSVFVDPSGNKYVSDFGGNRVRKIDVAGNISTIAGVGIAGSTGDGFSATAARVNGPAGVCVDVSGNIYITEQNGCRIRMINTSGIITTITGNGTCSTAGDGSPATSATVNRPTGITTDPAGNIFFAEWGGGFVRKINPTGLISRVAGGGGAIGDDGPATAASLNGCYGVSLDGIGNLFIGDQLHNRVRKVILSTGIISTFAGTGTAGALGDNGPATAAQLNNCDGVYADIYSVYIGDGNNNKVRKVDRTSGIITTVVGNGVGAFAGDGGAPATASLRNASGVMLDNTGNMFIADYQNARIRLVSMTNSTVATITGTTNVCVGSTIPLTDVTAGGVWSSSNAGIGSVGSTGIVTGVSGGTVDISYSKTFACGVVNAIQNVTVNPLPATPAGITGPGIVCIGTTITLNDVTPGGNWTSTSPGVATVGSISGVVTGITAGTAVISYTESNSCGSASATATVTVNAATGSVSGTSNICVSATTALTGLPGGGTWSSGAIGVAAIGSSSGVVNGVSAGNAVITYTYSGGCTFLFPMTVNPLPGVISGPSTVCAGSAITLTDGVGIWSSGSPGIATIGSSSGILSGIGPGTTVITFTLGTGCSANTTITVNATPSAITPPGPISLCVGATSSYADISPGGIWSSSTSGIATVGTGGLVTAVSAGVATITYTGSIGCYVTKDVTVNITPSALSPLSANVCVGNTVTFTDLVGGGIWSSSLPGTASVVGGVVTGIAAGTATINYAIGTCVASATVTVNANPAVINPPGAVAICIGATASLTDISPGGTWSSGAVGVATVGTSGTVTGVSAGSANISYTNLAGCSAVKAVTVNITPTAISPASTTVCTGLTVTLTETVGGGIWTTSAPGVATVAGGVVTGVTVGTATIFYTIGTCVTSATVTVNLSPNAGVITGPAVVCLSTTVPFTDPASGGVWSSSNSSIASVGSTGLVTGVSAGIATISYSVINICGTDIATHVATVTAPADTGIIVGLPTMCAGTFTMLVDTAAGGVWSVTNTNASVTTWGLLTAIIPGTDTIYYTVTNACGPLSARHIVTIGPSLSAGTISGPSGVCVGSSITLTDPAPMGVWSSSNSNAVVAGGIVTGLSGGIDSMMYTVSASCGSAVAIHVITITPIPIGGTILGPSTICAGMTTTYSDAATGGLWGTSNPVGFITVGGVFTAVTPGVDTIVYTVTNACGTATAMAAVTIGPAISAGSISGPASVCQGAAITLTDPSSGGVWSSSNTRATVSGGVVTGVNPGADTIYYTVTTSCGSVATSSVITVNPLPDAGTIAGPASVCVGSSISLSDPAPGGLWSAGNANATVFLGTVTGVMVGSDIISYTVTNSCGSVSAILNVTISNTPGAGVIFGPASVCLGATITLTDPVPGGVWTATNTNATVSGGIVTGAIAGVDTIYYTVTNSCGTATAGATVTVNPLPFAGAITGPSSVCIGTMATLTDAAPGGAWSAANANATVTGGIVTGVFAGIDTILYSVTNGCGTSVASATITINPLPDAGLITGPANVCVGSFVTLSDAVTGGVWSAGNAHASVSSSGAVTGITPGFDTISYTVTTGCGTATSTIILAVNSLPAVAAIAGPSGVCKSSSITLSDGTAGGVWSATNARATVLGGIVTGVAVGLDTILYTVTNICGSNSAIKVVSITQAPGAGSISGPSGVCVGVTIALSETVAGGTWSTSNSVVAGVSPAGIVSGVTPGTATISYTVSNGCGSRVATHSVSVMSHDQCNVQAGSVANTETELKVYPNPNKGMFTLNLLSENDEPVRVVISNVIGNKIKEFTTSSNKATEVNLNVASGIYLLSVYTSGGKFVTKVTIE